jgi:hypothetical protein
MGEDVDVHNYLGAFCLEVGMNGKHHIKGYMFLYLLKMEVGVGTFEQCSCNNLLLVLLC